MKKLFYILAILTPAFFAASCQQENLEPVVNDGVTYTITLPSAPQTKGENGYDKYDLYVEVYRTTEESVEEAKEPLFEKFEVMEGSQKDIHFDFLNSQSYTVLFWAHKHVEGGNKYFNVEDLRSVKPLVSVSNNDERDAYCAVDVVEDFESQLTKTVELKRPFAQLNIATLVPTEEEAGYLMTPLESKVKVFGVPESYNVATQKGSETRTDVEYTKNYVPEGMIDNKYTKVAMNYVLVPESNIVVKYDIVTPNGTVTNEVGNVPVKANYRTNIIGNLLTSNATYKIDIKPGFDEGETYVEVGSASALQDAINDTPAGATVKILLDNDIDLSSMFSNKSQSAVAATPAILVPANKTVVMNLNGKTISGTTTGSGVNQLLFDVRGDLTITNGTVAMKHEGENLAWNYCTQAFYLAENGTLNIDNATIQNLGGTDMAYSIDVVNAKKDVTLNITNSTIESTYIPVRIFNNGAGVNHVTIENSTLKGVSRAFWVHVYSSKDNGGKGVKSATLDLNIYNNGNTFISSNPLRIIEFGFDEAINYDAEGKEIDLSKNYVTIADGVAAVEFENDAEGNPVPVTYAVSNANGLQWVADQVNAGNKFTNVTVKLANDIDFGTTKFYAIGYNPATNFVSDFEGTFDGDNKTIKNLKNTDLTYANRRAVGLFSRVNNAVVKNLTLEDFVAATYGGEAAAVACIATGDCLFENITFKNGSVVSYNNDTAPVIGWANVGNFTLKDITVASDVTIYSLWDSYDTTLGGLIGTLESGSTVTIENANISCVLNAFNDCAANYQWYAYRRTGMVIGNMDETQEVDGRTVPNPNAAGVTCKNVTVTYGDWMNYHYCEFEANGAPSYAKEGEWKYSRVEGQEWGRESNIDTDKCQHDTDESHNILLPIDQLFGGGQGVYGLREYEGVTVNYPASYRREVSSAKDLADAIKKGYSVVLDEDVDLGTTILTMDKGQTLDLGGKTLTQSGSNRGIILKNGASIKNGVINHSGIVAAVRAWNIDAIENVSINLETPSSGTVTGIAVQQYSKVGTIKNVTVTGAGVTQAIEVAYQATVDLIENVTVDNSEAANGVALVINGGKVGKAKNCTFKGNKYGVTMHLKGVFDVALDLENCDVEGTQASIYAWDEKGVSNTSGSLNLTYDAATTLTGELVWDFEDECRSVVTLKRP